MKKHLMMFAALLLVVAVAVPAFAAVEFKYGGEFRARLISNDNNLDANDKTNDNQTFIDQRMRIYFTFIASENLRVVTKFEIGDVTWGRGGARVGPSSGGEPGADATNVETKNIYVEFNIPTTPVTAFVGIQGINLMSSWVIDDDFAAAVLRAKFDPITAKVGYVAGQVIDSVSWQNRIDAWFLDVAYKNGPWSGNLLGYYQFGHNTLGSVDPAQMNTPFTNPVSYGAGSIDPLYGKGTILAEQYGILYGHVKDNNLFDLGLNLAYKVDWMSAYFNFVKNLGGVDVYDDIFLNKYSADYTGFMIDAGANFFCGPYTFNVGGFYTTGDERDIWRDENGVGHATFSNNDINRFMYPLSTQKYFSEIIGGGILDNNSNIAHTSRKADGTSGGKDYQWEGYGWPSNIWTVTVGGSWQALEKTKLSGSYWYFGTSNDVLGKGGKAANDIGHELDFYVSQGIVDGLNLDLVAAYLIKGDAYSAADKIDDAYELGARLQWNF